MVESIFGPLIFLIWAGSCVLSLALLVFWVWMIIDCVQNEPSEGNDKVVWLLVILLLNWIGAAIYYFVRRPNRPTL